MHTDLCGVQNIAEKTFCTLAYGHDGDHRFEPVHVLKSGPQSEFYPRPRCRPQWDADKPHEPPLSTEQRRCDSKYKPDNDPADAAPLHCELMEGHKGPHSGDAFVWGRVLHPAMTLDVRQTHVNELTDSEAERLYILSEECGEETQAIGKTLRHGYDSVNPTIEQSPTNRELVEKEAGDIVAALLLLGASLDVRWYRVRGHALEKLAKLRKWTHHQKEEHFQEAERAARLLPP